MARKKTEVAPSIFRFMCIKTDSKNYHIDFQSEEEALRYTEELNDPKIEWYGVYELDPMKTYMTSVTHKRLIPHNDTVIYSMPKQEEKVKQRRKRVSRKK